MTCWRRSPLSDEHPSLRGIVTGPRITHLQLDDPELEPIWTELESRNIPLLLHPQDGIGLDILEGYGHVLPVGVGFPMETTAVVSRLVFGGVLFNHPDLKIIVSHGWGDPVGAGRAPRRRLAI